MCGIGVIVSGVRISACPSAEEVAAGAAAAAEKSGFPCNLLQALQRRGPDNGGMCCVHLQQQEQPANGPCLEFFGTTLQLRGAQAVSQPLKDSSGNILLFNGEVFGGLQVAPQENDSEVVLTTLASAAKDHCTVPRALSRIRGPWSVIYWQADAQTLWFGRDAFGRRSLLVHWPSGVDPRFLLSSVASEGSSYDPFSYWEELPCGIYSICLKELDSTLKFHDWEDRQLQKLTAWERSADEPQLELNGNAAERALEVLRVAVNRRIVNDRAAQSSCLGAEDQNTPVAVLFSGGIDSMILAALVDQCLDSHCSIDLLNVSFEGSSAPDRLTALAGLSELQHISPTRSWRLVEVNERLGAQEDQVMSLICPSRTHMDANIGTALWCAACGSGSVTCGSEKAESYRSKAKVVLTGTGADEQCGGYLRYRTKFKAGGWTALAAEMRLDMQRLWKRNLGRDDRCISDQGKEARFPFLDEDVIETLLDLPLHQVVDLREDVGVGEKKILRQIAKLLGLSASAALPKRAIQFGSGIAKQSNRKNFGSNRAANRLSAGSVELEIQTK